MTGLADVLRRELHAAAEHTAPDVLFRVTRADRVIAERIRLVDALTKTAASGALRRPETAEADTLKETSAMPINDSNHLTRMSYTGGDVTVVADIDARPEFLTAGCTVDGVRAMFRCGPITLVFSSPAAAQLWASALEVTAAEAIIVADHYAADQADQAATAGAA